MNRFELKNLRKRYVAAQCWKRNSTPNNHHFIRISFPAIGEEVLCFKDATELTVENVLHMVRYLTNSYKDELYLVDEHGAELVDPLSAVQHGRSYRCKRRLR